VDLDGCSLVNRFASVSWMLIINFWHCIITSVLRLWVVAIRVIRPVFIYAPPSVFLYASTVAVSPLSPVTESRISSILLSSCAEITPQKVGH